MTKEQLVGWCNKNKAIRVGKAVGGCIVYKLQSATITKFNFLYKAVGGSYEREDEFIICESNIARIYFNRLQSEINIIVR